MAHSFVRNKARVRHDFKVARLHRAAAASPKLHVPGLQARNPLYSTCLNRWLEMLLGRTRINASLWHLNEPWGKKSAKDRAEECMVWVNSGC